MSAPRIDTAPESKDDTKKKITSAMSKSDLTEAMSKLLKEKLFEARTALKNARFLIEMSSKFKSDDCYAELAIDFDSYVSMGHMMTLTGSEMREKMTLLELASATNTSAELLELIFNLSTHHTPNCVWLAAYHMHNPDVLSTLLATGKFNPDEACSYNMAINQNISHPLQCAVQRKSYDAAFILLVHNATPTASESELRETDERTRSLIKAAKELRSANDCYLQKKFGAVFEIDAHFINALKLNFDFVIAYLTKSMEVLNREEKAGSILVTGYPDVHLLKHYVKFIYNTVKEHPELLETLEAKDEMRGLCEQLMNTTTPEAAQEKSLIGKGACFFSTQAKKKKIMTCLGGLVEGLNLVSHNHHQAAAVAFNVTHRRFVPLREAPNTCAAH